ncbi:MAG: YycH family protein [Bacilli bacterium]|nr:YycH family protein [Bacilli bacterium]
MEKFKSIFLTGLVIASLVQSYFLAYSSPKFETVIQTDYVQSDVIGTQAELADVLYPDTIILHSGDNGHTVLPLQQQFYNMIYTDFLKTKLFDRLHRISSTDVNTNWDYLRNHSKGIELRFKEGIPLHALQNILQIKEDLPLDNDIISRIWIYSTDTYTEEVRALFISDTNSTVYEAGKVDISATNVNKFVGLGQYLTPYHSSTGNYYLPDEDIIMARMKVPYTEFTADQLKQNLFVDLSITRFLTETDGTQIYTDAKRALKIKNDKHWISFLDPVSTLVGSTNDVKENLLSAVHFINQHGGWNGTYNYSKTNSNQLTGPQTFIFRQYVNNYPLINDKTNNFGYIKLVIQKGVISSYERSLINLDEKSIEKTMAALPGGKVLDNLILNYAKKSEIVSVFPAYEMIVLADAKVDLVPRWAVELKDGTNEYL